MGNLDDTLSKKMKQLGIERQVEAAGAVEKATKEITKTINKDDFKVISFNNGIIKIATSSSVVASEIQAKAHNIMSSNRNIDHIKIILRNITD